MVYAKLQLARVILQTKQMNKSGHNKFAGYSYFELGDFLPYIVSIFDDLKLCSIVSFTSELASLRLVDQEDGTELTITSPMGSAALKGCHEVQNIGAVETYQRRYLYVALMDIVEHDALDSSEPVKAKPESAKSVGQADYDKLSEAQKRKVTGLADEVKDAFTNAGDEQAYAVWKAFRAEEPLIEEVTAASNLLPSNIRSAFKKLASEVK